MIKNRFGLIKISLYSYIHSTNDVNRLSFVAIANILYVGNWAQQVHTAQSQVLKLLLSEEPHTRRQ